MTPPGLLRRECGPLLAAAATVIGARCGEHLPPLAAIAPLVAVAAVVAVLVVVRALFRGRWGRRLVGLAGLTAIAAVAMARALAGLGGFPARQAASEAEGRVAVRLATDPEARWATARVPARLESVDGRPARGVLLVVAAGAAGERVRLLEAGESAVLVGWFRPLAAGERPWRWRHAAAAFEAQDLTAAGRPAPALLRAANGLRHRVLAGGASLGDTDRALVAGFLVGDDRDLPAGVAADFRAAGLSHLLVVSGANVTLALALVAPLLRRVALGGRLTGGLAVLVVFCAMTRFEPSVLRAAVMSGLALLAAFVGRPVAGVRLLALAVTGLVLADPFLTHSVGFGLSCGASAGILLLSRPIAARIPGPRPVRESLAITASAQIGVAPIALPAFGHLPLAALPANLAAAPAAAALSLWGLGSGLAGGLLGLGPGSPGGGPAALLQSPTALLAEWIRAVAHLAARCPVMVGPRPAAVLAAAGLAWWWRRELGASAAGAGPAFAAGGGGLLAQVDLQADQVVEGEQAGPGDEHGGGGDGVEQVELEPAAPAGRAQHAEVPLHLGHDPQELHGDQRRPQT